MQSNSSVPSGHKLLSTTSNGCTITWDIEENYINNLSDNTLLNKSTEDITVNVFATIKYGDTESEEIKYTVVVYADTQDTDFDGYYKNLSDVTGEALKQELRSLITSTHTTITSYDSLKNHLQEADEDPNNPNNMILFYTGASVPKTDNMNVWNREHVWAQSLSKYESGGQWFGESGAGADAHHIRPCNPSVNSSRGNDKFGTSSGYYEPTDEFKGDVARIIFYMMVRYTQADSFTFTSVAESLDILLEWNELDPVSPLEENRNDVVEDIQGNRNPFIDYPEFAEEIWG